MILTIRIGVRMEHDLSRCKTGDTGDFIEFVTLAEEIKSLRLVPRRVSLSLYEQDVHGIISMGEEEEEVRKNKKRESPVVVVGGGLYRVRHPHYMSGELRGSSA